MKATVLFAMLASTASLPLAAQPPSPPPPPCTPAENVVCGQQGPEDLVALGPQWIAAGAYVGSGGVVLSTVKCASEIGRGAVDIARDCLTGRDPRHGRRTWPRDSATIGPP